MNSNTKFKGKEAINIALDVLEKVASENNYWDACELNIIKRTFPENVRFLNPIYQDKTLFLYEIEHDLQFRLNSKKKKKVGGREIMTVLESFFRNGYVNARFKEFPVLMPLVLVSAPNFIVAVIKLIIDIINGGK